MELGVAVGFVQVRNCLEVSHLHLRLCRQRHGTENTWQSEHVLAFEEGTVRMAVNLYCYRILLTLLI